MPQAGVVTAKGAAMSPQLRASSLFGDLQGKEYGKGDLFISQVPDVRVAACLTAASGHLVLCVLHLITFP